MRPREARALWDAHHDELLSAWIEQHPGSRPAAWWLYEAPEPRRRVSGCGTYAREIFRNLQLPVELGIEAYDSVDEHDPPRHESQAAYLDRLGLLVAGELERIPADAFEPELVIERGDDDAAA